MAETSYNSDYAPYARSYLLQAPIPATTHNLPATIAASSSVLSSLIVTEGFSLISAAIKTTQAGTMTIQRYLDAGGTVPQGAPVSVNLTANSFANLDITDGKPFASFQLTVSNSAASTATISNFALLVQATEANTNNPASDGSTTITTGGTAQTLFGGVIPTNGFSIGNPDPSNDLWISDSTTAAANATGCIRIAANGGYYATEAGQKPMGAVSVYGAVTGQKITARRW